MSDQGEPWPRERARRVPWPPSGLLVSGGYGLYSFKERGCRL
ncbi:MAG TPA: hypothetical protein VF735_19570 [Pyrinomonadaceae bacterium]